MPNPDLESERATSLEIAWEKRFNDRARLTTAAFYADVADAVQTVVVATAPAQLTQAQNVGRGRNYGIELSGELALGEATTLGGNYTWLERNIVDALQPSLQAVGTPTHQGLLYVSWTHRLGVAITPSVEFASKRWSDVTGGTYRRIGAYALINLQAQWRASPHLTVALGGRNLADRNYALADGYPEPGRTLYAKLQLTL